MALMLTVRMAHGLEAGAGPAPGGLVGWGPAGEAGPGPDLDLTLDPTQTKVSRWYTPSHP